MFQGRESASPFDKRCGPAWLNNNNLFSKRQDAFSLTTLDPVGATPPLNGYVKSHKSLDFDNVSRWRTFASHMTDETRKMLNLFPGREL